MPETAMHKNDCSILAKNNVWTTGKTTSMKTISKTTSGKEPSYHKFGLCILPSNTTHHPATSGAIDNVRQEESRTQRKRKLLP